MRDQTDSRTLPLPLHPHDGEMVDWGPRAFVAGGHRNPGVVLAKGAGPGIYNRWRTCTGGKSVLWARVAGAYLA